MRQPLKALYLSTATWTVFGLLSGLYYRELTRSMEFTGQTQLSTAHTHYLALGTLLGLILLLLERSFQLSQTKLFSWLFWLWNIGVFITASMQVVKGSLQVITKSAVDSSAIAGISGLGHIILTIGFVMLFLALWNRIKLESSAANASAAESEFSA